MKPSSFKHVLLALLMFITVPAWSQDDEIELDDNDVSEPSTDAGGDAGELTIGEDEVSTEPAAEVGEEQMTLEPELDARPERKLSNADVVAVVHNPFLKQRRIELSPSIGVTMNDNIIRHYQFNGQLNYYLSARLAIGVEGGIFADDPLPALQLTGWQARRLPTVNKYNWGAALNLHYVPIYGKFALFGKKILQWETFVTVGIGVTQSEVIPRNAANDPFTNILITPNVGASFRFFITKWLTVQVGVRDYLFLDKFEDRNRGMEKDADAAKQEADSAFVNHLVFQAGISVWIPFSFDYTTFR